MTRPIFQKLNTRHLTLSFLLALIIAPINSVFAQQIVYVNDILYVPLRTGASTEYRIINAAMKSGTKLTRLDVSEDEVWSLVRTEEGVEGWVRNQYLSEEMTSELKLNLALTRIAKLEQENASLKENNANLTQNNASLTNSTESETQTRIRIQNELDKLKQLSAGAIELDRRYQELLQKHELTQTQRDSLLAENENLKNDQRLTFMLYGAGILILGVILALVLPALKPKKGYSEWK